ncbi:MAG: sulfide/dihydroorotate dehydrogenase-like FAD/NAD-binding protein [Bacillota bacterium]
MYKILCKRELCSNVNEYVIDAPMVAKNAKPGQFIILRTDAEGERVPFTICDINKVLGTITILVQTIGATTAKLATMGAGDSLHDFVGPLGNATDLLEHNKVLLVAGGIGNAVIYPQAKFLAQSGKMPTVIVGARTKELVIYSSEITPFCDKLHIMTDDGSFGEQGFVTNKLKELLDDKSNGYDAVMAVGPLMMMKAVCDLTRGYNIPTVVSMNSIMVDGTGMCGGCRVTVGGETKYACVDGPEFDGHLIDFDEARLRGAFYREQEADHMCKIRGGK